MKRFHPNKWVMNDDGSFSPPHAETEETNEEDNKE